jgi:predicted metal-dependent hydrolase
LKYNILNSTKTYTINPGNIEITVTRKKVKYLRMSVSPLDGTVKISSPFAASSKSIEDFAIAQLEWIEKHQRKFKSRIRPANLEFVSGESLYFRGKVHKLEVRYKESKPCILIDGEIIVLYARPGSNLEKRKKILNEWYRKILKKQIPELINKWAPLVGGCPVDWGVKNMKTRWGSCNTNTKKIWISLKLAEKSTPCLEYVVVHEMVHLLERGHGKFFKAHMDRVLPDWRSTRNELNSSIYSKVER